MDTLLTVDEYKAAPTAIDLASLTGFGEEVPESPAAQDAELARVIARATSCIHTFCSTELVAGWRTERTRARANAEAGGFIIKPRRRFPRTMQSFAFGQRASALQTLDNLADVWVDEQAGSFIVPVSTFTGPTIQLGAPRNGVRVMAEFVYDHGWANPTLTAAVGPGDGEDPVPVSLPLTTTAGIAVGDELTILDPLTGSTEVITVLTVNDDDIAAIITADHAAGVAVSNMPEDVKQAAIMYVTALIKTRGDAALALAQGLSDQGGLDGDTRSKIYTAQTLLWSYRRTR